MCGEMGTNAEEDELRRSIDRTIDRLIVSSSALAGVNELMIVTLIDCGELVLPGCCYLNEELTIADTRVAGDCEMDGLVGIEDRLGFQTCTKVVKLISKLTH